MAKGTLLKCNQIFCIHIYVYEEQTLVFKLIKFPDYQSNQSWPRQLTLRVEDIHLPKEIVFFTFDGWSARRLQNEHPAVPRVTENNKSLQKISKEISFEEIRNERARASESISGRRLLQERSRKGNMGKRDCEEIWLTFPVAGNELSL